MPEPRITMVDPREASLPVPAARVGLTDLWSPGEDATALATVDELGHVLQTAGHVTASQLDEAREQRDRSPGTGLARTLIAGGIDEAEVQRAVAREAGFAFERIDPRKLDGTKWINRLGLPYCEEHGLLPLRQAGPRLVVGFTDVDSLTHLDEVRHKLGVSIKPVVVTATDVAAAVANLREGADDEDAGVAMEEVLAGIDEDDVEVVENDKQDLDLEKMAGESPVIRYVNYLIFNAVKEGASDIHIEPQDKKLQVRYRIDGMMFEAQSPPTHMQSAIISRIKIMANLDIAERRMPQDGRIRAMVHGRKLDLRVSTLPMVQGEKAVLRILDTRSIQVDLEDLGMGEDTLQLWTGQITSPHGIVLVTGPTGSGKTTTLYASLNKMDRSKLNISTAEDPVEYHLNGINQTQVHEKIGMSFAAALRALLRQDPDVIMVGEIRDAETAKTAIQASLTGHLVLSTLHTNDAPSAVTRLVNIGVEPYLIGSAVNGVLAQRLVRKICTHCKEERTPEPAIAEALEMQGLALGKVTVGAGCDQCRKTGYSGRQGIYELLVINDTMRDRIAGNPNVTEFRRMCIEAGMVTLRDDGFNKVAQGTTTVEEVMRVTTG